MSGDEYELARGLSGFQVRVGLGRVLQGVGAADADVEVSLADPGKEALRAPQELLAGAGVLGQGGTRQEEAALLVKGLGVEGGDLPARPAEEDHVAARLQAVEGLVEGVLAYGVVDHVHALAGDALRLGGEVLLFVQDHLVGAGLLRERGLLLGAGGPYDGRAAHLRHLAEQEADAAGGGVHEGGLPLLERERAVGEVVGGHPLEHDGRGHPCLDHRYVKRDELVGGGYHPFGVGARHAGPRDEVPGGDLLDTVADGLDLARALQAQGEGGLPRVDPAPHVHVYKVDAACRGPYSRLARARFRELHVLVGEGLRTAVLVYPDRLHPRTSPLASARSHRILARTHLLGPDRPTPCPCLCPPSALRPRALRPPPRLASGPPPWLLPLLSGPPPCSPRPPLF